ncbi:hypothetical protein ACP70R_023750 [Stipagrostis hirtigluma subsp. patula]
MAPPQQQQQLAKPRNLGSSLPVPNVQDLAARPGDLSPSVLGRYLRDTDAAPAVVPAIGADDDDSVPVVDLARLLDPEHADEEAARLRVVDDVKEDVKGFFHLPLAEKRALAQEPGGGAQGYGQAFVVSEDQKLDWADMYFLYTQPPEYRELKFWTLGPPTFRDSMERYSAEVQRVATDLLRIMAKNLGVEHAEKMTRIAEWQGMRMNYYPPCPPAHDKVLGLSPHSDPVGLTLLLQVSPVAGLQIRRKGGWIPVAPLPGALVANVGDVIEVLTNGSYKSIEHRAVVSACEERVSVAAFHSARFGGVYGPLEEIAGGCGEAPRYKTASVEDYVKLVLSSKLDGKSIMDAMKINP